MVEEYDLVTLVVWAVVVFLFTVICLFEGYHRKLYTYWEHITEWMTEDE